MSGTKFGRLTEWFPLILTGLILANNVLTFKVDFIITEITGLSINWLLHNAVGGYLGAALGCFFGVTIGTGLGNVYSGIKNGAVELQRFQKNKLIQISVDIEAPLDEVFNLFTNPHDIDKATGRHDVRDLTRQPATLGATWILKNILFGNAYYCVTGYERPYRYVKDITGNTVATVEDVFSIQTGKINVQRSITVNKLHWMRTIDDYEEQQQELLGRLKAYLEKHAPQTFERSNDIKNRVKCKTSVGLSPIIKGRKQTNVEMEVFIATTIEQVFNLAISKIDRYWNWMQYRSDPSGLYEVSPNWPKTGSEYSYRIKTKEIFNKWETGIVSMLECEPYTHASMKEIQRAHIYSATGFIEWKFKEVEGGTLLSVRYELTPHNFLINTLVSGTSMGLEESIANLVRICESEK